MLSAPAIPPALVSMKGPIETAVTRVNSSNTAVHLDGLKVALLWYQESS